MQESRRAGYYRPFLFNSYLLPFLFPIMSYTRTLVWHFYKPLMVFNLIFTLVCLKNLTTIGLWFFGFTVFIKLIGYAGTIAYKYYFSFKTNIYYNNAGYSLKKMYTYAFGFDMAIYLAMVALFYLISWSGLL